MYPNLRAELARRNMNIPQLAELTGIKTTTLYDKFNGRTAFTLDEAVKIRDVLGLEMSIDELFKREDEEWSNTF